MKPGDGPISHGWPEWTFGERRAWVPRTLQGMIADQFARTPDALAVTAAGEALTYRDLDRKSGVVAARLRALGVGSESLVGISIHRSSALIVALVGILRSGAAYLPIDPDYPTARIAYIVQHAHPACLLVAADAQEATGQYAGHSLCVDDLELDQAVAWRDGPEDVDSLAYVLYTSGSTGEPKGVQITHRAVHNRLMWMQEEFRLNSSDAVLQKTSISFDVSVWELFWPLCFGARLVMARPGGQRDPDYLREVIAAEGISVLHFVPSMLAVYSEALPASSALPVRLLVCSGEELTAGLRDTVLARGGPRLVNLYGPTEAAIDVTWWDCNGAASGTRVPLGRPIANTRVLVLDENLNQVAPGAIGELYLGGVQLARGYLGLPQKTADRFVPDPKGGPGDRLYRTGDLGHIGPDGLIYFNGRRDDQLKIRGFRVEPAEIEAAMARVPGICASAVSAGAGTTAESLVAYIVPAPDFRLIQREVVERLSRELPEYMVPQRIRVVSELPLSSAGKLDRRRLDPAAGVPLSDGATIRGDRPAMPEDLQDIARRLTAIWERIIPEFDGDIDASFFAVGGDSLKTARVAAAARRVGLEISINDIFDRPTIRELAAIAGSARRSPSPEGVGTKSTLPMTVPMATLLSHAGTENPLQLSKVCSALAFDWAVFTQAVRELLLRHSLLRSSAAVDPIRGLIHVVHPLDDLMVETALGRRAGGLTWAAPPAVEFQIESGTEGFTVTMLDLMLDESSRVVVLHELLGIHQRLLHGKSHEMPLPSLSWYEERERARDGRWRLTASPEVELELSREKASGCCGDRLPRPRARRLDLPVPRDLMRRLRRIARSGGVELSVIFLTAHVRALAELSGHSMVEVDVLTDPRDEILAAVRSVGPFREVTPVRIAVTIDGSTKLTSAFLDQLNGGSVSQSSAGDALAPAVGDQGAAFRWRSGFALSRGRSASALFGAPELRVTSYELEERNLHPLVTRYSEDVLTAGVFLRLDVDPTVLPIVDGQRFAATLATALDKIATGAPDLHET